MSDETIEGEVIVDDETEPSTTARRIRVYKGGDGDFFLDLPAGCRCTFGYFNPAGGGQDHDKYQMRPGNAMKTTCLRIYEGKGTTRQLAAFLGVQGFRDESIKLTKLVRKVTIEKRMADDGEGSVDWSGSQQRELTTAVEVDEF